MSKPVTHVLVLVDRSCSMLGVAEGVRVGINAYVADLGADDERDYRLTMAAFDEQYTLICAGATPEETPRLTAENYRPDGQTALLDALARMFDDFAAAVPTLGDGDKVLAVIATDGGDNASIGYSPDDITKMVTERERGPWTFIHLAADVTAGAASHTLGLRHVLSIAKADLARRHTYDGMGLATRAYADGTSSGDITALLEQAIGAPQ
jgi:hypothetical protein